MKFILKCNESENNGDERVINKINKKGHSVKR